MVNKTTETSVDKATVSKFVKSQILASKQYENRKDVLSVLLDDNTEYSTDEVEKILDKFLKVM